MTMAHLQIVLAFFACYTFQGECSFKNYASDVHGKEYMYNSPTRITYQESIKVCDANNATVVQIRSKNEFDWILQHINPDAMFHIGVRVNGTLTPTHFLDGSRIEWYSWNQEKQTSFNCTSIAWTLWTTWDKVDCSRRLSVMCERPFTINWYMAALTKALDELETRIVENRENATLVNKGDLVKEIGPTLLKVIGRIKALPKKR